MVLISGACGYRSGRLYRRGTLFYLFYISLLTISNISRGSGVNPIISINNNIPHRIAQREDDLDLGHVLEGVGRAGDAEEI